MIPCVDEDFPNVDFDDDDLVSSALAHPRSTFHEQSALV